MTLRASMKHGWIAIALACGACAAGGGGNAAETAVAKPQAAAPGEAAAAAAAAPTRTVAATTPPAAAAGKPAPAADAASPTIPAGARWTIFCDSITSDDHVARATSLKEVLMKNAKARDWYVIHQEGRSSIYLGYYKEIDAVAAGNDAAARADAQRAKADKQAVESIPNPRFPERKLFPRAQFAQLDAPDPDAPPAWSLTNAQGYWSVQVAAFTGGDRKQHAVEAVRQARAMNVEAYYYHGTSSSSVCIGHWPADALKRQGTANAESLRDDNETLVVNMAPTEISEEERRAMAAKGGGNLRELRAKVEILDETLKATLKQYPEHAVDGFTQMTRGTDPKTGKTVEQPVPSYIVRIPRAQLRGGGGNNDYQAAAPAEPSSIPPAARGPVAAPPADLGRRLRGIGQ